MRAVAAFSGRRRRASAGMRRTPVIVLCGLLLATTLAACDDDRHPAALPRVPGPTTAGPGLLGGHVATADRGDLDTADFELASGVTTIVLRTADLGHGLYRITTPDGAGQLPKVVVSTGHVVAQLVSSGENGPSLVDITLSDAVAWTIHLDGGATSATVDAKAGGLKLLDLGSGIARIEATLPAGASAVRMSGGSSEFTVHAPTGVPARVSLTGGAGRATIDGATHNGIAGGTVFTPDGWDGADPRIDVDNTAGVSAFTLDRY
jgi:hypothetical protein